MTYTDLDAVDHGSIGRELIKRAHDDQSAAIEMLTALGTPANQITVDVGALDVVAHERCENDTGHGPGTCVFPGTDGLCPGCTVDYIKRTLLSGQGVAIDVLL